MQVVNPGGSDKAVNDLKTEVKCSSLTNSDLLMMIYDSLQVIIMQNNEALDTEITTEDIEK